MRRVAAVLAAVALLLLLWWFAQDDIDGPVTESRSVVPVTADLSKDPPRTRPRRGRAPAADVGRGAEGEDHGEDDGATATSAWPRPSGRSVWEILLLSADGRPVPGIPVHDADDPANSVVSGADGVARIKAWEGWGGLTVASEVFPGGRHEMKSRRDTVRTAQTVPVSLELVHALTGERVTDAEVSWDLGRDTFIPMRLEGGRFVPDASPAVVRRSMVLRFDVKTPGGMIPDPRLDEVRVDVSGAAREVRHVLPLWPPARFTVRVVDSQGMLAQGVAVERVYVGSYRHDVEPPLTDSAGRTTVEGVVFVPGEPLLVVARRDGVRGISKSVVLGAVPPAADMTVTLGKTGSDLPFDLEDEVAAAGSLEGLRFRSHVQAGSGNVSVLVRRRDGSALAGATVSLGGAFETRTDAGGRAVIRGVGDDRAYVMVHEVGFTALPSRVDTKDGKTVDVVVEESPVRDVRVRVVDDKGVPAPFAAVRLADEVWFPGHVQIVDGVQYSVVLTDAQGEAVLRAVPSYPLLVRAVIGSRIGGVTAGPTKVNLTIRLREPLSRRER